MIKKKKTYLLSALTVCVLVCCFAVAFYALGWSEPEESPPKGNVYVPINEGEGSQLKEGLFVVTGSFISSLYSVVGYPEEGYSTVGGGIPRLKIYSNTVKGTDYTVRIQAIDSFGFKKNSSPGIEFWSEDGPSDKRRGTLGMAGWNSAYSSGSTPGDIILRSLEGGDLLFSTGHIDQWGSDLRMIIKNNGLVGIGTETPSEELEVAGNIKADNITASGTICDANGCIGEGSGPAPSGGFTNLRAFTSSGRFTVPDEVNKVMVEVWGAGGGGAYTQNHPGAAGGGGGGYSIGIFEVVPGDRYDITVGDGGGGGKKGNEDGETGETSFFTSPSGADLLMATGGGGGRDNVGGDPAGIGGRGGVGMGGIGRYGIAGSDGGSGQYHDENYPSQGANGGNSGKGGGGGAGARAGEDAVDGQVPGGGGGGGTNTVGERNGGDGADGMVVVWW